MWLKERLGLKYINRGNLSILRTRHYHDAKPREISDPFIIQNYRKLITNLFLTQGRSYRCNYNCYPVVTIYFYPWIQRSHFVDSKQNDSGGENMRRKLYISVAVILSMNLGGFEKWPTSTEMGRFRVNSNWYNHKRIRCKVNSIRWSNNIFVVCVAVMTPASSPRSKSVETVSD